jgi:hypothetical protein
MKNKMPTFFLCLLTAFVISANAFASVPTEEGLLKNLNNADLPGQYITIKMMGQSLAEQEKADYVKFIITLENPNAIGLLQVVYNNSQMQNSQIKSVKYTPDLLVQIRKEKSQERAMFFASLMMLATNRSAGMEAFLEKNGVSILKNKNILNQDKMKLLRDYRTHLVNSKGKGDAGSPLNPEDPAAKQKALELFRANTFKRAPNVELVKKENEFMWKTDWKSVQGFFSNEERRLREIDLNSADGQISLDANTYVLFNGVNELPKFIGIKDQKGINYKLQVLSLDTKLKGEKRLSDSYEELKKLGGQEASAYPFLY